MFKTILVQIDGSAGQANRLRAAAVLAEMHGAHLVGAGATGISLASYAVLNGGMAAPLSDRAFEALRDDVRTRLDAFIEQAQRLGIVGTEARLFEGSTLDGLLLQSRYADLIVVSQADANDRFGTEHGLPQSLALGGTRPVLVVPPAYAGAPIPGNVLVGWDGSMPAQRAISAALPLLTRAANVTLGLINPEHQSDLHGEEPGADMALYLARHGVTVNVAVAHTRARESDALIGMAREVHAGLLVTGAFGHSRYREWFLGGVTRDLLGSAPVPLLIAH
ncbi:nucleotide-binding universal stress UspA family protein [Massilia sp. MP_M2]|uniref:universal stress protein n=1 Tax=Massilia sp. MP_M2 TaxID=3071713 RepID=UPI00319E8F97